jgi:hypothetical protein
MFDGSIDVNPDTPLPIPQKVARNATMSLRASSPQALPLAAPSSAPPEPEPPPPAPPPPVLRPPSPVPAPAPEPPPRRLPSPIPAMPSLVAPPELPRRGIGGWWILIAVLSLGALGYALYTFAKRNEAAKAADAERKRKRDAANVALAGSRGDVVLESEPGEAAAWLLLGRTPLDTMPLGTASVRELRIETPGFVPADVVVTPAQWTGRGALRAAVRVSLSPAAPGYLHPAAPPAPPSPVGGPAGEGIIHVESEPPGAEVWLLVGFTGMEKPARVNALAKDKDHTFKLLKDGHTPGVAIVRPADWVDGRKETRARATLQPLPPPAPAPKKR